MHRFTYLLDLFLLVKKGRFIIETKSTLLFRFSICRNSKCKNVFVYDGNFELAEDELLCPTCRKKIQTHHLVQCSNCNSIVNFIEINYNEEPVIFYVEKCSQCIGTKEDENKITIPLYPDAFI
ncbi:hypothetical protein ABRY23_04180 [Melioribacteraceae bacterium 4301-Me]|uniref:hypothetical protein n=1 Tax=Pyranulibacter aquaticus TaxID=3163344 RepID=UPI003599A38B